MKNQKRIHRMQYGVAVALMFLSLGCTAVVKPHVSESDFLSSSEKIAANVDLYVSDDFRSHHESQTDVMDMKKWDFELGPVASDAFKYSLAAAFKSVTLKSVAPKFPLSANSAGDLRIAVRPAFASFDSHFPWVFKFETYSAEVGFTVDVYDADGKKVISKTYQGRGEKRGSIGFESAGHAANPVAAELAIRDAVQKSVADIQAWAKSRKAAATER
jgi:hypothetical protein